MASTAMVSMGAGRLLFGDLDYFASLVFAAAHAHTVRQLGFVAIGTLGQNRPAQGIVRPARRGAPLGVSSFGIWHFVMKPFRPHRRQDRLYYFPHRRQDRLDYFPHRR